MKAVLPKSYKLLIHRVLISSVTVLSIIMFPKRVKRNSWVSIDPNGPTLIFSGKQDFQNSAFTLFRWKSNILKDVNDASENIRIFIAFSTINVILPVNAMKPMTIESRTGKGRIVVNLTKQNESVITQKDP